MKARYIPNILSIIRILMVFVFVLLFFWDYSPYHVYHALIIFLLAGATDVLDGMLARKYHWISDLGKLLDPLADKLMQCVALICLYIGGYVQWWLLAVIIGKELLMGVGALFMFKNKNVIVVSRWYGKAAVCIFYASIIAIVLFGEKMGVYTNIIFVLMIASAIGAIASYYRNYIGRPKKQSVVGEDG